MHKKTNGQQKTLWRPQKMTKLKGQEVQTPPTTSGVLSSKSSKYEASAWRKYMSPRNRWKQLYNVINHVRIPVVLQATFKELVQPWTLANSIWLLFIFYFGVSLEYFVLKKFHELGILQAQVKDKISEAWWSLGIRRTGKVLKYWLYLFLALFEILVELMGAWNLLKRIISSRSMSKFKK